MYADHLVQPWFDRLVEDLPDGPVLDVHTHLGDRDSVSATAEELLRRSRPPAHGRWSSRCRSRTAATALPTGPASTWPDAATAR